MGLSADAQRERMEERLGNCCAAGSSPSCSVGPDCPGTHQQPALVQTRFS